MPAELGGGCAIRRGPRPERTARVSRKVTQITNTANAATNKERRTSIECPPMASGNVIERNDIVAAQCSFEVKNSLKV